MGEGSTCGSDSQGKAGKISEAERDRARHSTQADNKSRERERAQRVAETHEQKWESSDK